METASIQGVHNASWCNAEEKNPVLQNRKTQVLATPLEKSTLLSSFIFGLSKQLNNQAVDGQNQIIYVKIFISFSC